MKRLLILLVSTLMLTFSSCTEELNLTPESLITVESFWKSPDDARGGLYAMYNQFRNFAAFELNMVGGLRSGLYGVGTGNPAELLKYMQNDLTAVDADIDWEQPYKVISYANLVINKVPNIDFSEAEKNDILAQAYAMRAYMYFTMAKTWGDIPLVTESIEGIGTASAFKPRTPVSEIFQFIKSDIDQALSLFSTDQLPAGRSTWSKPATNALKGDVYLWTGKTMGGGEADFSTALNAFQEAETGNLALLDNYDDVFNYDNKGNQEIIFAVHFEVIEGTVLNQNFYSRMYENLLPASLDEETRAAIGVVGGRSFSQQRPSDFIRNMFTENDQRKNVTYRDIYEVNETGERNFLTSVTFKGEGTVVGGSRYHADDVIIYRYAELLLFIAETKNALGQDPSEEINKVLQRAYGDSFPEHMFVAGSRQENDEVILRERLMELAFESKSWWDFLRFGKAFELIPSLQGREGEDYLKLFPLTQEMLSLNSKLTQNPGY